ncbi:MAG: hypothetical protein ACM3JK_05880 [Betaproteobacteria bacterium]
MLTVFHVPALPLWPGWNVPAYSGERPPLAPATAEIRHVSGDEGIRFSCNPDQLAKVEAGMTLYLSDLGIGPGWVIKKEDPAGRTVVFTLNTPKNDFNTLNLKDRAGLTLQDDWVTLPAPHGKPKRIRTVSKKEIVLAMLQHGRLTDFSGSRCDTEALKDHVGIRQNTVAWVENLNWVWPDGRAARWNAKYWRRGTPRTGVSVHEALNDMFAHQHRYSIGCYTATKVIVLQGVLDYYARIKRTPALLHQVEKRVLADNEPLVNLEPGRMWDFEEDFDPAELGRPGKILTIQYGVAPKNFIPGDWVYLLNTDPKTKHKTGYEGSNAIYMGRNKFDDYFNDHGHAYTYEEKLDEVYQWRNGVFSRSRDAAKIKPLSKQDLEGLGKTPAEGGMLMDFRVFPYLFGYEALP